MEPKLTNPFTAAEEPLAPVVPLRGDPQQPQPDPAPAPAARKPPNALRRAARGWLAGAGRSVNVVFTDADSVLHDRLPSLAQLWQETRDARWAPVDAPVLILLGRAYRIVVVLPLAVILYPAIYLHQRPLRLFVSAAVAAIAYVCIAVFGT
ncbi:hypothetical protein [Nonomuraea gerenzanensis]|uniref:Uncharacterized protein n=1 Tax=Nonomuraea gerenzanensis TaxID=93944 RepID=A0A1M4BLB0_9ACTN|nr:hypothetical protein [Nonomuraea gerenzanensis]UBU10054.1 hypothetical protein LCN96_37635 [Nonomuraea gerenzanensis]SAP16321.1 hypothetical protein BN4615_P10984 [Nonomuraea gerenzanensis]